MQGTDNNILKFENFQHLQKVDFVIYLDMECLLETHDTVEPNQSNSFTIPYQSHKPYSFAYYIVGPDIEKNKLVVYTAKNEKEDVMNTFFFMIKKDILEIDGFYKNIVPLNLSAEDIERFSNTHFCEHCGCSFENQIKTHDHYHYENGELTGRLRKVLCQACNLSFRKTRYVPILAHNLSNYDGHLIFKGLAYDNEPVNVIPTSFEKYIGFTKKPRVDNLPKDNIPHIKKFFPNSHKRNLLLKKGVFCYDYLNEISKLEESKLPERSKFFSRLYNSELSDDKYEHALTVWKTFKCKTLGEYAELYLKSDVLQLTEVFEDFRHFMMKTYGLDPVYYFSIPGLSFDCMMKHTGVEISLLQDIDMQLMIERSIRGGISQCSQRYAESNNHHMGNSYNPDLPSTYLTYLDANNLYGYSMVKKHPLKDFKWMTKQEIKQFKKCLFDLTENDDEGFFLEVDIVYPDYLHNSHNDLPFLPEKKVPPTSKNEKLLTTFDNKYRYVLHYLNLQQALSHGLILKKIHRGIKFTQSDYLATYINFNTELRKTAKNMAQRTQPKLLNNVIYGRSIEDFRKRSNLKVATTWNQARKLISKSTFLDYTIINENLVLIKLQKKTIKFMRPIFLGASILELSKIKMYHFLYSIVKPYFGPKNVKLLYMDTDSFFFQIKVDDLYEAFKGLKHYLDTSDYPSNHFLYSNRNKKKLGKFKDELNGMVLTHFVGLASKLYAYKILDGKESKIAKGISTNVIRKEIKFEDYVACLFEGITIFKKMNTIVSQNHNIQTVTKNKKALTFNDDKRFSREGQIKTYAHGHYKIMRKND
uniref:DNA-directed DNA polymerase n=1 Tax=Cacopsylla melanoneura TaxID=428564 RepID=A0A8D8SD21_9HEMI